MVDYEAKNIHKLPFLNCGIKIHLHYFNKGVFILNNASTIILINNYNDDNGWNFHYIFLCWIKYCYRIYEFFEVRDKH